MPVLEIRDLRVQFPGENGWVTVLDDLTMSVGQNEVVGLVGESGSGKSVTAACVLGLIEPAGGRIVSGSIRFRGTELIGMRTRDLNRIRGKDIAMVFQEPMTSLNPAYTVGSQIAESVRRHTGVSRRAAWARAVEMLTFVEISDAASRAREYPHSFSGGMRQRVMIAMALACEPDLLIADEPTTALDVTVQASVLALLEDLQRRMGMSMVFISHDLGVIGDLADVVAVMYAGQLVELGAKEQVLQRPNHPYTEGLLRAMPERALPDGRLASIAGTVPPAGALPVGCRFHPRCGYAQEGVCTAQPVPLRAVGSGRVRCARTAELQLRGYLEQDALA